LPKIPAVDTVARIKLQPKKWLKVAAFQGHFTRYVGSKKQAELNDPVPRCSHKVVRINAEEIAWSVLQRSLY
jgi:hypothetical protein